MLESVDFGRRDVESYRDVAPDDQLERLIELGSKLRDVRILHLNATPYGGGVSELLRSILPLLADLGLRAEWKIIGGDPEFFEATKQLHNALQGDERGLDEQARKCYLATARRNAERLDASAYDVIFVHDPQPAPLAAFLRAAEDVRWIWRCHIDTSEPNPEAWEVLRPYLPNYDAAIFTMEQFVPPNFPLRGIHIFPPAIDPLSPKNMELPEGLARQLLAWIGVRLDRPLITQVSRFDPWKDPWGVIEAYRIVREEVPNVQLALVGSMALDDPEGWEVYHGIKKEGDQDRSLHVFTNLTGVGNVEVNAMQRLSDVAVQKSIREGFGLVVSETLWKETPMVAGRAGGIPLQMADGVGGVLVDGVEECAEGILRLLREPEWAADAARRGRERVRTRFLLPRLILNQLELVRSLLAGEEAPEPVPELIDPVCGMAVTDEGERIVAEHGGERYYFCSRHCLRAFREDPERYVRGRAARP